MFEVQNVFKEKFGAAPAHVVRAPGRLELLGNHTDYNLGLVLSLAVDKYIFIASSPRTDGTIALASSAFPQVETFPTSELKKNPQAPWADYVKGVLEQLRKHGVQFDGFSAAIHGTLPIGAGMSSSAALEVATALTVRQLFPYAITGSATKNSSLVHEEKLALAKLCRAAENQFVGVQSGILDQISSLFGKAAHAIQIDCQELSVGHVPMLGDIAVVVCDSGAKHSLVGGGYNELRQQCESAAKKLGVAALRAVDMKTLKASKSKLSEREFQCAFHIVGENERVMLGNQLLRANDFKQFGQSMFQSHESSRDSFGNSTKELDLLVEIARKHPAIFGARLTGGGFGGATINLVQRDHADVFMEFMAAEYEKKSGFKMKPMLCQIVDGAN